MPRGLKESTRVCGFYTSSTHRSNTKCHITDCHAGNPCEIESHPTAQDDSQMIDGMIGYDSKERVMQGNLESSSTGYK
ncbi:hypothetical protein Tco_0804968 [Tanacetum coccineum]